MEMITLPETVDAAERLAELLKSVSRVEVAFNAAVEELDSFQTLLEYAHTKEFEDVQSALQYIDNVLIPQLKQLRASLEAGSFEHIKRLKMASDQAERMAVRLRMLTDGSADFFLP
jgi:hypothetical protein